jgi:FkbM family methyltransferase
MIWQTVPGAFNFDDCYDFAIARYGRGPKPAHFVEVGVQRGRSTLYLAEMIRERGAHVRLSCVDPWRDPWSDEAVYRECLANLQRAGVRDRVEVHRRASPEAADAFADGSLAFVFLDGGHERHEVAADLAAWWPKLAPDGLFCGHDYADHGDCTAGKMHPGVVQAVDEFVATHGLQRCFRVARSSWVIDRQGALDGMRQEYDLESLADLRAPHVLDIGANRGDFARYVMQRWPGATVECFEPHPETFAKLRGAEDLAGVGATCAAVVHPARGRVKLFEGVNSREECSLRDDVVWPGNATDPTPHVSQKLDQWIEVDTVDASSLGPCDVLKIDTEGSEVEILTGYRHLPTVRVLLVEAHAVGGDLAGQMDAIRKIALGAGLTDRTAWLLRFVREG